jgi:hypothetical protein
MLERLRATRGMENIEYEEPEESADGYTQKKVHGRTLELFNAPDPDIQVEQDNNNEKQEN